MFEKPGFLSQTVLNVLLLKKSSNKNATFSVSNYFFLE